MYNFSQDKQKLKEINVYKLLHKVRFLRIYEGIWILFNEIECKKMTSTLASIFHHLVHFKHATI